MSASQKSELRIGVTEPVSLADPTELDVELTLKLKALLYENDCFESPEGERLRVEVLTSLNRIFRNWIKQITIEKVFLGVLYHMHFSMINFFP